MKNETNEYQINWDNVNLENEYFASRNFLEPYSFDTLLLEIDCNLREINKETVKAQAMEVINAKYREAIEILNSNLDNIINKAIRDKNDH